MWALGRRDFCGFRFWALGVGRFTGSPVAGSGGGGGYRS